MSQALTAVELRLGKSQSKNFVLLSAVCALCHATVRDKQILCDVQILNTTVFFLVTYEDRRNTADCLARSGYTVIITASIVELLSLSKWSSLVM
jgi:hypothetical protein